MTGLKVRRITRDQRVNTVAAYRPEPARIVIEYIAVDNVRRGEGLGCQLLAAIQHMHSNRPLYAQTDDEAVGFYEGLGFSIAPRPRDPRWPSRQRYDCTLNAR